ncbi:hypothetical protein TWF694_004391 [Orbilia ellipsospora]|uniref:Uncharacterized protein n=1 Tax=Orbilia ellipsospora TaxID=2528407 RepID=A0AAV9WW34_9PEZI
MSSINPIKYFSTFVDDQQRARLVAYKESSPCSHALYDNACCIFIEGTFISLATGGQASIAQLADQLASNGCVCQTLCCGVCCDRAWSQIAQRPIPGENKASGKLPQYAQRLEPLAQYIPTGQTTSENAGYGGYSDADVVVLIEILLTALRGGAEQSSPCAEEVCSVNVAGGADNYGTMLREVAQRGSCVKIEQMDRIYVHFSSWGNSVNVNISEGPLMLHEYNCRRSQGMTLNALLAVKINIDCTQVVHTADTANHIEEVSSIVGGALRVAGNIDLFTSNKLCR